MQQKNKFNYGKTLRICDKGHRYYKSSDCPTCPQCENEKKPENGFLSQLSAPARRALENNNIKTLNDLARFSEYEILQFHGVGKNTISKLNAALHESELHFKKIES